MKSQIFLFLIVLFFVSSIAAQPFEYQSLNPKDLCNFKEGKTVFIGRVISIEAASKASLPEEMKELGGHIIKHTVSVEKVFSGQIKLKEIKEFFLVKELDPGLAVNDEVIFVLDENQQKFSKPFWRAFWSVPLSQYNAEEKAVILSRIEARMNRFPKSPPLTGIVLENYVKPTKVSLELSIIYGDEVEKHSPVAGIIVIAKSKKNGQVHKTETKENGVFTFDILEDGDYALSIVVPKGFEQVFRLEQHKYQERVIPVKKDNCGSAVIFKVQRTKKF